MLASAVQVGGPPLWAAGRLEVGLVRSNQEDAYAVGGRLLVVADGMGGQAGGEVASAAAVARVTSALARTTRDPVAQLRRAVGSASTAVSRAGAAAGAPDAATTLVLGWLPEGADRVLVAHVGDSRAGLLRDGTLTWLTRDHNLAELLHARGELTEDEALHHPGQHQVLRWLGGGQPGAPRPDLTRLPRGVSGRLLLCSDGLCGYLPRAQIAALLAGGAPADAADRLQEGVRAVGAPDNTAVIVADLGVAATGDPPR